MASARIFPTPTPAPPPQGVELSLTMDEAWVLAAFIGSFVCGPDNGPRGQLTAIVDALDEALGPDVWLDPRYVAVKNAASTAAPIYFGAVDA